MITYSIAQIWVFVSIFLLEFTGTKFAHYEKEIRINHNLNQSEFGEKIGVSQSAIGLLEKGLRNVTDRNITLICSAFNINEKWLRSGDGEPIVQTDASILEELVAEYHMTDKQKRIISSFINMDDAKREVIAEAFFLLLIRLPHPLEQQLRFYRLGKMKVNLLLAH